MVASSFTVYKKQTLLSHFSTPASLLLSLTIQPNKRRPKHPKHPNPQHRPNHNRTTQHRTAHCTHPNQLHHLLALNRIFHLYPESSRIHGSPRKSAQHPAKNEEANEGEVAPGGQDDVVSVQKGLAEVEEGEVRDPVPCYTGLSDSEGCQSEREVVRWYLSAL
ncbi:hypothetical protein BJ165DRAFT_1479079 [Panaeolus papilionaceus]|nr:hypothetical protein BJ165DRAFT_1479079 [Panaeolus papilionaceus]